MYDILRDLYTGNFSAQPQTEPEQYRRGMKVEELWEKVEERVGEELRGELQEAEDEVFFESSLQWYREGFRLGALLMLEVLQIRR